MVKMNPFSKSNKVSDAPVSDLSSANNDMSSSVTFKDKMNYYIDHPSQTVVFYTSALGCLILLIQVLFATGHKEIDAILVFCITTYSWILMTIGSGNKNLILIVKNNYAKKSKFYSLIIIFFSFILLVYEINLNIHHYHFANTHVITYPYFSSVFNAIIAGSCKELLSRGCTFFFLYYLFKKHVPLRIRSKLFIKIIFLVLYIVGSSVLFMLAHHWKTNIGLLFVFISGLLYASLYIVTGSLLIPVLLHIWSDMPSYHILLNKLHFFNNYYLLQFIVGNIINGLLVIGFYLLISYFFKKRVLNVLNDIYSSEPRIT